MLPRINWLIEKGKEQLFRLLYLRSEDLPPDLGTKRLAITKFKSDRDGGLGNI